MTPDVAASVKARLLNHAREQRVEFERVLTQFASERVLYRLGCSSARERLLLKGASLLSVWMADPYRSTRDIDLLAFGATDPASLRALVEEVCAIPCPADGLTFDLTNLTISTIQAEDEYTGQRVRFVARLGTARISVQLDLGTGDAVSPEPIEVDYPRLLDSMPAPRLRTYPREASLSEKVEAMVKLGIRNSRMKDFHDLWALTSSFAFDGESFSRALTACFERRGTDWVREVPGALRGSFYERPDLQARWAAYRDSGAVLSPPPAAFTAVGDRVIRFLTPIRDAMLSEARFSATWPAGGPWQSHGPNGGEEADHG